MPCVMQLYHCAVWYKASGGGSRIARLNGPVHSYAPLRPALSPPTSGQTLTSHEKSLVAQGRDDRSSLRYTATSQGARWPTSASISSWASTSSTVHWFLSDPPPVSHAPDIEDGDGSRISRSLVETRKRTLAGGLHGCFPHCSPQPIRPDPDLSGRRRQRRVLKRRSSNF